MLQTTRSGASHVSPTHRSRTTDALLPCPGPLRLRTCSNVAASAEAVQHLPKAGRVLSKLSKFDRIWEDNGRSPPMSGGFRTNTAQIRANFVDVGPNCDSPMFGRSWANVGRIGRCRAKVGRNRAKIGRKWPTSVDIWPMLANAWPMLIDLWPKLADVGKCMANSGRS